LILRCAMARSVEYRADRDAAYLCGDPEHVVSALRRIASSRRRCQLAVHEPVLASCSSSTLCPIPGSEPCSARTRPSRGGLPGCMRSGQTEISVHSSSSGLAGPGYGSAGAPSSAAARERRSGRRVREEAIRRTKRAIKNFPGRRLISVRPPSMPANFPSTLIRELDGQIA
jgi:hypothetical protein